jgi:hypothetical protein
MYGSGNGLKILT